ARARALLVQDGRGEEVASVAAVLLVVLHAEQPELAHARPDPAGHPPRRLPLRDVRHDLLLDEAPHRRPEYLVLVIEDFHGAVDPTPASAWRRSSAGFAGAILFGGRLRRGPSRPPPTN